VKKIVDTWMNWISLTTLQQLDDIRQRSFQRPQVIFKHSTHCSVSSMVLNRLKRSDMPDNIDFYYLDLIAHKDISNKIAKDFEVQHQSPQILLIKEGEAVYDESHMGISMEEITDRVS
jgi:bacillithiol system protein YtxJ